MQTNQTYKTTDHHFKAFAVININRINLKTEVVIWL